MSDYSELVRMLGNANHDAWGKYIASIQDETAALIIGALLGDNIESADAITSLTAENVRLQERVKELEEAVSRLSVASADSIRLGAQTGPQWTKLTIANLRAIAALKGSGE